MSSTWFHTSTYGTPEIKPVQVVRSTTNRIVIADSWNGKTYERQREKTIASEIFRPTWEECHAWLLENAVNRVIAMNSQVKAAEERLRKIKGMEKP